MSKSINKIISERDGYKEGWWGGVFLGAEAIFRRAIKLSWDLNDERQAKNPSQGRSRPDAQQVLRPWGRNDALEAGKYSVAGVWWEEKKAEWNEVRCNEMEKTKLDWPKSKRSESWWDISANRRLQFSRVNSVTRSQGPELRGRDSWCWVRASLVPGLRGTLVSRR